MSELNSITEFLMTQHTINKSIISINNIENPQSEFAKAIELLVATGEYTYIEAIIEHCTRASIDVEVVPKLLTADIKRKLKSDAIRLNFIERGKAKTPKLPL